MISSKYLRSHSSSLEFNSNNVNFILSIVKYLKESTTLAANPNKILTGKNNYTLFYHDPRMVDYKYNLLYWLNDDFIEDFDFNKKLLSIMEEDFISHYKFKRNDKYINNINCCFSLIRCHKNTCKRYLFKIKYLTELIEVLISIGKINYYREFLELLSYRSKSIIKKHQNYFMNYYTMVLCLRLPVDILCHIKQFTPARNCKMKTWNTLYLSGF